MDKPTLKFLGRGGAFASLSQGNSNAVLTINGKNLLIDFGVISHVVWRDEFQKSLGDIDAIFCSHVHSDHCCLEPVFFYHYFYPNIENGFRKKLELFCDPTVLTEIWESLRPSMETYRNEKLHISNFADCHACKDFIFQGIKFTLVKNQHIRSSFGEKPAFGLKFTINKTNIYWSSDSATVNEDLIKWADIVFHDCETGRFKSTVHAHYDFLKKIQVDRSKIWLMHYTDPVLDFSKDGFAGFVQKGQEFVF